MSTTKTDIREWLERGREQDAAYMLVVCDTFDWEDYPVYAASDEDLVDKARNHSVQMQKVMECYKLSDDWDAQLSEERCWHGWNPVVALKGARG